MEKYFLDKRTLVNGRKSHIYLDNFIALHDYIIDVITGLQPYTFQNGLTESPALTVELGGNLIRNTTINGQNIYKLLIDNIQEFQVKNTQNGFILGIGDHTGHSSANPPMAGLYRSYNTDYRVGHYIVTKSTQSQAISSYEYINSLDNSSRISITNHSSTALDSFVTEDDGLGFVETGGIQIKKNYISLASNTSAGGGLTEGIQIEVGDGKGIQFFGTGYFYYFPDYDGTVGQVITTDGTGNLSWQTPTPQIHKCEVLYFNNNPLNDTYNVNGAGNVTIDSYILPGNTLTTDGSYIELEVGIDVSGTVGTNPVMYVNIDGKALTSTHIGAEVSYYQLIKTKCIRISSTTFLITQTHTINDPVSGATLASYSKYDDSNTLVSTFGDQVNIDILFPQNLLSDQVVELKHFVITKYLK
jgi:hypothetical protein